MSQRSDVFKDLRGAVRRLGNLKGKNSTLDLIEGLDDLWAHLIKARAVIVKTLMNRGDIESPKDVDPRDFLSLYLQVHNPKRDSRLCEHCCGSVEFGLHQCPYCGETVNGQNSSQFLSQVVIDFDVQTKAPDWNIDTDPSEILDKNKKEDIEGLDYIKPITKRDDIIGPKGEPTRTNVRKKFTLNRPTRDLIAWVKKRELAKHIPYTVTQLQKLSKSDIYLLLSIFKDETDASWTQLIGETAENRIRFILGHQGPKPIDIGEPPYGALPDLSDIIVEEDDNG